MRVIAALAFFIFPILAQAQGLPTAYVVTGVATNDVLNIRVEPSAASPILGELGPYAVNIEVIALSEDGKWGKVSAGERNGWVAMRYLEPSNHTPSGEVPRPMSCFGTEPFWVLAMYPKGDEYEMAGDGRRVLTRINEVVAWQGYAVMFEEGPTLNRTLMISRGLCSDGMSELDYGWQAILLNETPEGDGLIFGCCTLDHR